MRTITTENGSIYTVDEEQLLIKRLPSTDPVARLRRDDEWVRLQRPLPRRSLVGENAAFILEPLGEGNVTVRLTTTVLTDTQDTKEQA